MKKLLLGMAGAVLLAACASRYQYGGTYQIGNSPLMGQAAAEDTMLNLVAAGAVQPGRPFDQPMKLLRAPPPQMPPADVDQKTEGRVTAQVLFAESGMVESVKIISSTKDSLAESVTAALLRWQIAPATREGKPVKVTVQQTFGFKAQ
jgi:TonB family protein